MDAANKLNVPPPALGTLDAEATASLIAATADIALVVDDQGIIRELSFGNDELAHEDFGAWVGQHWSRTVTVESRPKVEELLREAATQGTPRWRQVNHPSATGTDVPVLYSAIRIGAEGRVIAVGRNLRAMALLQQRLIDAQQSMEREYSRLRHAETRYRLLFQLASEAVLIVDAGSQRVVEANPASAQLLGEPAKRLIGRVFPDGFDEAGTRALQALLDTVRIAGRADDIRVRNRVETGEFLVSASLFRQESNSFFLVRLAPVGVGADGDVIPRPKSKMLEVVEIAPDGFVVTTPEGRIVTANRAFLDLAQVANEEQVRGEPLERWLGRSGVDFSVLAANLRQHGSIRLFKTVLRGEYGSTADVELSAVSVVGGEHPCLGFSIRSVGSRITADPRSSRELPHSVEQLTELVGRVSLKDLVRETTDVIERLCIEAALELTGDNRASAADLLGLSRQSLYVKLRRYGLGDLGDADDAGVAN